jgi:hypothetical protein
MLDTLISSPFVLSWDIRHHLRILVSFPMSLIFIFIFFDDVSGCFDVFFLPPRSLFQSVAFYFTLFLVFFPFTEKFTGEVRKN